MILKAGCQPALPGKEALLTQGLFACAFHKKKKSVLATFVPFV
jgi:hypothetical protein